MNRVKDILKKVLKNVVLNISKAVVFIILGIMVVIPFIIKNINFKDNDIVIYKKTINVIPIENKVKIKVLDSYLSTNISYDKYDSYITSYKKSSSVKKVMVIELYLLFILLEAIFLYFVISNIIKLFIDKEEDEYKSYIIKKYFCINIMSIFIFDLIKRFIFRNTIFSSLDSSITFVYIFVIIMFYVVKKIFDQNRVTLSKRKLK